MKWLIFPEKIEKIKLSSRTIKTIRKITGKLPNRIVDPHFVKFWHDPDMSPHGKRDWSGAHSMWTHPPTVFLGSDVCYNTECPFGLSIIVHELTHCSQSSRYGVIGWLFMKVFCRFLIERWATQNERWVMNHLNIHSEVIE